jgi:hypothetical protein
MNLTTYSIWWRGNNECSCISTPPHAIWRTQRQFRVLQLICKETRARKDTQNCVYDVRTYSLRDEAS